MLTKSLLQQLANASSYQRGEAYFRSGAVRRIKREGNRFTGKVAGSELYRVSLSLAGREPDFECSCPYDYDGLCKHAVAFGLAVLDQFGPSLSTVAPPTAAVPQPAPDLAPLWQQTTVEQKLAFLRQLLDKQPDLRVQLAQFVGATATKPTETDNLDTISTAVFEALSDLRFDDEGLEMDEYDYYSEEAPDAEPLIEEVLNPYADRVTTALREGRLTDAMTVLLGVYEGVFSATEPAADEYGVIGDYPTETWAVWNRLLADAYAQLAGRVLHPDQIGLALGQLADRIRFFDETEANPEDLYYDLKEFEPLLLALVTDLPSARAVQKAVEENQWQKLSTEYVQLHVADVLRDPDLWLQTADRFADRDVVIARQLLQRQQQAGDAPALLKTLHRLGKRFPNAFDEFILAHLDAATLAPGPDLNLYLTALENRSRGNGDLGDYRKLREYFSEKDRRRFADSLKPTGGYGAVHHPLFYAQVLHLEGRHADLLAWLEKSDWLLLRQTPEILKLAVGTHPGECLTMTIQRSNRLLDGGGRGRELYQAIAGWLAALHAVPSLKPQVAAFAQHLYATHSRLNALREELRGKGLVVGRK